MLNNSVTSRRVPAKSGFTIVELLVVIVVIAILAAITVVTYSGVQGRARDVATASNVRNYVNGLEIFRAYNGHYYYDENASVGTTYCLGGGSGGCGYYEISGSQCEANGLTPGVYHSTRGEGLIEAMEGVTGPLSNRVQAGNPVTMVISAIDGCSIAVTHSEPIYVAARTALVKKDGSVGYRVTGGSTGNRRLNSGAYVIQWAAEGESDCHLSSSHAFYYEQFNVTQCSVVGGDVEYTDS